MMRNRIGVVLWWLAKIIEDGWLVFVVVLTSPAMWLTAKMYDVANRFLKETTTVDAWGYRNKPGKEKPR